MIGGKHAVKQHKTASDAGIESVIVDAKPLSKKPVGLLKFGYSTLRGFRQCLAAFDIFRPDALLTMGSYAGFPPYLAARRRNIPLFLHDGNARLGKGNGEVHLMVEFVALDAGDEAALEAMSALATGTTTPLLRSPT